MATECFNFLFANKRSEMCPQKNQTMKNYLLLFSLLFFASCNHAQQAHQNSTAGKNAITTPTGDTIAKVKKTEAEWKAELSADEYYVLR